MGSPGICCMASVSAMVVVYGREAEFWRDCVHMSLYGQPPISLDMACLRMSELLMPSPSSTDITELEKPRNHTPFHSCHALAQMQYPASKQGNLVIRLLHDMHISHSLCSVLRL